MKPPNFMAFFRLQPQESLFFSEKCAAKVLLFCELCKSLHAFPIKFTHFRHLVLPLTFTFPCPSIYSQKRGEIYRLRVWQGGYKVNTTPLNRRGNSCLRSPHSKQPSASVYSGVPYTFFVFLFFRLRPFQGSIIARSI